MSSTKYSITNTTKRTPSRIQPNVFTAPNVSSFLSSAPTCTLILDSLTELFGTKRLLLVEGKPIKIGRSINKLTNPAETNGYYDSKVLSRTHAEIWLENGKSSNGTFVNGRRINYIEYGEDEKVELKIYDIVEFGIDIFNDQDKKLLFRKVTVVSVKDDEDTNDITNFNFTLNPGSSIYDFLEKELLNCQEESQRLNEMSTTLNDITNLFDNTDKVLITKTTNVLSKRDSCPEKGKLEKSLDNVIHKENRENGRENRGEPSTINLNGKGSCITSTNNVFEDLNYIKYDNKRTIKLHDDEIGRLNEEIKRSNEKFENQAHTIVLKDCEIKSLQADNKRLTNEISKLRQDLEKSNTIYNKYRELVEKEQSKHKTDTEMLIFSLRNELKDLQKTNSMVKSLQSQLEDSRALNELLKKNYESLIEENKKLRENIRRAKFEKDTQLDFVKKLGHEIAMNSGLENDLSKSSLPQVTRNGHSKQISEPIKDSEWTGESDGDDESPIININLDNVFNKNKVVVNGVIIENNTKSNCIDVFNVISTDQAEKDSYESRIITDKIANNKQETINGDLNKNKLTKKCSRAVITSSKGRVVKTAKNGSRTESSDNGQVVKKVGEVKSERGSQLIKIWYDKYIVLTICTNPTRTLLFLHSMIIIFIQTTFFRIPMSQISLSWLSPSAYNNFLLSEISTWNFSLLNWLNLNLSWLNISTWDSLVWDLPITEMVPWNVSKINVESLKIGASALEFSVGWVDMGIRVFK
ncbi:21250_t:CDS:10 [Cetraspora pellucida]|uniref:21250_t:CDS:1 n=1 Tax=Cetraspora pellucida TaxID=1433469 RepID=A0A9N9DKJ0_9GLOM|nr:21250_t:CDS:10 [Cetraspora pellucida]